MQIEPFRGWRPRADLAHRIASYPYDVVTAAEARSLTRDDPYSFLHVVRAEADLPPETDPHDDAVYARARQSFEAFIERGWLARDAEPAYYLYRLTCAGHMQTGIVGAMGVADYREGRMKRHEHTRPDKVEDRARLNDALSAHPGPVLTAHRSFPQLTERVAKLARGPADVRFVAADGIEHALWIVADPEERAQLAAALEALPAAYIADGHHRAEAAARVCAMRQARHPQGTGSEPYRAFLTALFPADELRILDYNRVVRDLNGLTAQALLARLRESGFDVEDEHPGKRPPGPHAFGIYAGGRWSLATARPEIVSADDPIGSLDVSILTSRILEPYLAIGDLRTDRRIEFVGGVRGMDYLEQLVDSGSHAVAFALHPTPLADVMRVADAGQVMPPKSTWFEPKLRSGLVVQSIDGDRL